ncbi:MAG TPA: hypothetical protein VFB39_15805 [Solirubrobacteraceae bacterium]|nr:hypothetical protein [Solirubrobacteraceae bacterium]
MIAGVRLVVCGDVVAVREAVRAFAGEDVVKIVWHITGHGPLKLAEYDERGRPIALAWGPEAHGTEASNYARPGEEWGAGYLFRQPGCYHLTAHRTKGRAEVWLWVHPSPPR